MISPTILRHAPTQILDLTALNCSSHERLSSMTTPKHFDIGTCFISVPFDKEILLGTENNALLMNHHTLSLYKVPPCKESRCRRPKY